MPDISTRQLSENQQDRVRLARKLALQMVHGQHPAYLFVDGIVDKAFEIADRFYDEVHRRDDWR